MLEFFPCPGAETRIPWRDSARGPVAGRLILPYKLPGLFPVTELERPGEPGIPPPFRTEEHYSIL